METCVNCNKPLEKGYSPNCKVCTEKRSKPMCPKNEELPAHYTCVLCDKKEEGYGNNAMPVKKGQCCNECNIDVVLPARIKKYDWGKHGQ